jgi:DNA primase
MDDIVEQVKQANRIEDVIGETCALQNKRGRYLRSSEHDSLVIDTRHQTYSWNSKHEIAGDVIEWVERRNGYDFKTAVEWLCRRGKLPDPKWTHEDHAIRLAVRAREEAFAVANTVMQRWLQEDGDALAYARGRGWTDETILEAGLGFSGRGTAAAVSDLRGELSLHGVDVEGADAVAILGWRGDVKGWAAAHQVQAQDNWVEWGFIPGLTGKTRLVYAHVVTGRVRTFSGRNILGAEINREGKEVKSFNLPVALCGERAVFFNHAYKMNAEECAVVEGQADAVTLGQWGIPAVALAGVGWQDHEVLLRELRKRHGALYLALDADAAGGEALIGKDRDWPLAKVLGPMCRVVKWEVE